MKSTPSFTTERPIRLAIIGCGVIAQSHLKAATALSNAQVVALADIVEGRVKETAQKFNIPRWTTDTASLLADPDVDAVVLALPAHARTPLAIEAFRHGKHVLTEKPVAMNSREVEMMIAAQGDRVGACCSSRYRFCASARAAEAFIASGKLGPLRMIRCRGLVAAGKRPTSNVPEWRLKRALNGGGILMNWGCYDLDYLLGLNGWSLKPISAFASTWEIAPHLAQGRAAPGSDAETHVAALVRLEGGAVIQYERAEAYAGAGESAWQIVGEKGCLHAPMLSTNQLEIVFDAADGAEGVSRQTVWSGPADSAICHRGPVTDFVEAILTGQPPRTTLRQALVVQQITDAIYRSAASGQQEAIA